MLSWLRKVFQHTELAISAPIGGQDDHPAEVGAASVYFIHTVPTSKRINLGKATEWFLDSELAVSAAWPTDSAVRVPPSLARIETDIYRLRQNKAWIDEVQGWKSFLSNVLLHPVVAVRVLRLVMQSRRRPAVTDTDTKPFEESLKESEEVLLRTQSVSIVEQGIDGDLFWSERDEEDAYVRIFLRSTEHTIRIREKDHTVTLEPRVMLHRGGTAQITVGVHLPVGCTPAEIVEASFPAAGLFHASRIPEPYAEGGSNWADGEWAEELEGGVRVRVINHEEPASIYDWLELTVGRVLRGIGSFHGGAPYTYPLIMAQAGECCADWADTHKHEIVCLTARSSPRRDERLTVDIGPNLSAHSAMRIYATAGAALVLFLKTWRASALDLHHVLLYERIGLIYVRLRSLEQRIADFRLRKHEVLRTYRTALELEKEVRGAYYRNGTARDISDRILSELGAPQILEVVRTGVGMLGERASTRASLRAAKGANRIALVGLVVAVIAAVPAIPLILKFIDEQRAADPTGGVWGAVQALVTSPLLLSALILSALVLYGLLIFCVVTVRVVRYLLGLRKRGFTSRIEGYEITVDDPADGLN